MNGQRSPAPGALLRALAAGGAAALVGCTFQSGRLSVASTQKVPTPLREMSVVEGRDCTAVAFGIPLGPIVPSLDRAVSAALAGAPGADSLVKATVYRDDRYFVVYQRTCIRVKGLAASTDPRSAAEPTSGSH